MMVDYDWKDPKARMAHAREARFQTRGAKTLGPIGPERQPDLGTSVPSRPEETPNPILEASEPFSFTLPERPHNYRDDLEPRPVVEAEIDELMSWGMPRYQEVYPRCIEESVRPMLIMGCRGGRMRFLRTVDACGLFIAEVTPWEPALFVYQVFV